MGRTHGIYKTKVEVIALIKRFAIAGKFTEQQICYEVMKVFGFSFKMTKSLIDLGIDNGDYIFSNGILYVTDIYLAKKEEEKRKKEEDQEAKKEADKFFEELQQ